MSEIRPELALWVAYLEKKEELEEAADRIAELEAALKDMAKHVWRGDWDKLKPETRALLGEKK